MALKLTIKGTEAQTLAALGAHNIAPLAVSERYSQFVADLVTCDVVACSTEANIQQVREWFGEGDELIGKGVGFPVGTLYYFAVI